MDLLTLFGFAGGLAVLFVSLKTGGAMSAFANTHGMIIVLGGTACALMLSSSYAEVVAAMRAFVSLFRGLKTPKAETLVPLLAKMCGEARRSGLRAIQDAGASAEDDGFMGRAIDVALGAGDIRTAQEVLEREINIIRARHREVANTFRTIAALSPMFGLLGTLIGIIAVLKNLTQADTLGPSMAIAISSAFYGISIANLICVPVAGKLRSRSIAELNTKELVMVGILDIVYTQKPPTVVELGLRSFLTTRQSAGSLEG
ncbi:MAG: MotA/TolQ/ExbB proton channel family protein [Elusimicrobia bacterium]|nr:MotA/TolQ/ExbB proton channel family protein [Elusimicrobiota bacterium]